MLALPVITTICTVGVAFYVRFLFALWKEIKPGLSGFGRRFQAGLAGNVTIEVSRCKISKAREVLRLIEVKPNSVEELRKDVI